MKKKISELMGQIDLEKLDTLDTKEMMAYELSDIEVERIHKKVVAGYKGKAVPKKKKNIRLRMLLVAAVMLLGSTTVFALAGSSLFDRIFKENKQNLGKSGQIIDLTANDQHIKVNIKGIVGYSKRLAIILEVQKIDGSVFEGNVATLQGYLDIEGQGQQARYFITALKSDLILNECTETKKVYRIDILNTDQKNEVAFENEKGKLEVKDYGRVDDFAGKKATLVIEEVSENYDSQDMPDVDITKYMDHQAEKENIPFDNKKYEFASGTSDQNGNMDIEIPRRMLAYKKIGVPLYEKKSRILLDNIGFIDGKLHVRLYGQLKEGEETKLLNAVAKEGYSLFVADRSDDVDAKGVKFIKYKNYDEAETSRCAETYYIFDVKENELLQHKQLLGNIHKTLRETETNLEIPFEIDVQANPVVVETNKYVPTSNKNTQWQINKVELSNVALGISLESVDKKALKPQPHSYEDRCKVSEDVKLKLVDGTEIKCKGHSYGAWDYDYENPKASEFDINIFFIKTIDATKVKSISIEGEEIMIKEDE